MAIRLRMGEGPDGRRRVHVDGAHVGGVFLEKGVEGTRVSRCGIDPRRVVGMVEGAYGVLDPGWDDLVALARGEDAEARDWEPYTATDAEGLTPRNVPFPERTGLLVDRREPAAVVDALRSNRNLEVEVVDLAAGRYEVPGALTFDRIDAGTFAARLLREPTSVLRQIVKTGRGAEGIAVLIMEGDPFARRRQMLAAVAGAHAFLASGSRLSMIQTIGPTHSAYVIASIARQTLHGPRSKHGPQRESGRRRAMAAFILEAAPHLNGPRAHALLTRFGSVAGVCAASAREVAETIDVGIEEATAVHAALNVPVEEDLGMRGAPLERARMLALKAEAAKAGEDGWTETADSGKVAGER